MNDSPDAIERLENRLEALEQRVSALEQPLAAHSPRAAEGVKKGPRGRQPRSGPTYPTQPRSARRWLGRPGKNLGETPASPIYEKCCLEDTFFYVRNNAKQTNTAVNTSTKLTSTTRSKSFIRQPPRMVVPPPHGLKHPDMLAPAARTDEPRRHSFLNRVRPSASTCCAQDHIPLFGPTRAGTKHREDHARKHFDSRCANVSRSFRLPS